MLAKRQFCQTPILPNDQCLTEAAGGVALRGTATVIPTNPTHKHQWYINRETYKSRNLVERTCVD